jgi:cytochrome c556
MTPARRAATAFLTALLAGACGGPAPLRYEEEVERTPAPVRHAVHDRRLGQVMTDLDRLRSARLPQAMEKQAEVERIARELERIARAMAESARQIGEAVPAGLDPDEQRDFRALAAALERQSEALADELEQLTPLQRRERLMAIDATCGACHARFRIPLGAD